MKLCNQSVKIVNCFKYLGTYIHTKLNFTDNVDAISKTVSQRLFLMRKQKEFGVLSDTLEMCVLACLYLVFFNSIWVFDISFCHGHLALANRNKLNRITTTATR